jgi:DNA adenine methylase
MKTASPLRYPGGKACLAGLLSDVIDLNGLRGCAYYEPYAGGAGAALGLLKQAVVSEVFINDFDFRVNAFWHSALNQSYQFVDRILKVPLTINEWKRQREICGNPRKYRRFDVGFAAFYMNRCNRSGVLTGAGPIGGLSQNGKWTLGVRFNREPLAERILALSKLKQVIHISQMDALQFLKSNLPRGKARKEVFVYLDPPYVQKGQRLYLNAYNEKDHGHLASYIQSQGGLNWLMSYDDSDLVRNFYSKLQVALLPINYSLQEKRAANELVIAPTTLALPRACRLNGKEHSLNSIRKSK